MLQWLVGFWRFSIRGYMLDMLWWFYLLLLEYRDRKVVCPQQWPTILRWPQATARFPWWEDASTGHRSNATTLTSLSPLIIDLANIDTHNIRSDVYILLPVISIQVLNLPSDFSQC